MQYFLQAQRTDNYNSLNSPSSALSSAGEGNIQLKYPSFFKGRSWRAAQMRGEHIEFFITTSYYTQVPWK